VTNRSQKITFGEMRESGVRGVLICALITAVATGRALAPTAGPRLDNPIGSTKTVTKLTVSPGTAR
jgi:hypothetical protein